MNATTPTPEAPTVDASPTPEMDALRSAMEASPDWLGSVEPSADDAAEGDVSPADAAEVEVEAEAPKDTDAEGKATEPDEKAKPEPTAEDRAKAEWQKIEAEKSRLAKEREEIEQAKAAKSTDGFTAEDYEAVAEKFAAEGQDELATQARAEAAQLRHKAHVGKLTQAHNASLKTLVEKYPDLKNPESSLYKRVDQTLKSRPALFTYAEGISDAIEACAAHESATRATQLEKELAEMKQRLADTEKKLHPTSGGPSSLSAGDGSFNRLPADRQFAELRKQAMAADRAGENFLG